MEVVSRKCPCCGAALAFDPAQQKIACKSCGQNYDVKTLLELGEVEQEMGKEQKPEWHLHGRDMNSIHWDEAEASKLKAYTCPSCGAEIIQDATLGATECVYCGSNAIMESKFEGVFRPDGIVPFKTEKKQAQAAFTKLCKGKRFLPNGFADKKRVDKITGVYVPFWLFRCKADGDMTFRAERVRTHRHGDKEVTSTDHYLIRRAGNISFSHVPVDGSKKFDNTLMEAIEPFDCKSVQPFAGDFLAGFQAERFDEDAQSCVDRANERIENSMVSALEDTVLGYTVVLPERKSIELSHGDVSCVLMPVWMLYSKFAGKDYVFAMNGQTGSIVGDLPVDKGKAFVSWAIWSLILAAVIFGICLLISM